MSEEWKKFVEDPRPVCKYSRKCYQKNPQHQEKFKHPPNKRKIENADHNAKKHKTKTDSEKHKDERRQDTIGLNTTTTEKDEENNDTVDKRTTSVTEMEEENKDTEDEPTMSTVTTLSPRKTKILDSLNHNITNDSFTDAGASPDKIIKELFLVTMPVDFYSFWEFISKESKAGMDILKSINLEAVGPFEVLMGTLPKVNETEKYLVHWRFFYDPPEFQTVLKARGKGEFHIGYFRDSPSDSPVFVGSNDSSKNCLISPLATNIFGALYVHLELEKKRSPFTAMSHQKVMSKIKLWADEHEFDLEKFDTRKRLASLAVTKTFHGAGIVVPYDKSTQLGYRPLAETDAKLKNILTNLASAKTDSKKNEILSELQPVITYANIAMDECDFGTGLELGIDLFCSGLKEFDDTILSTLTTAYNLLNRQDFVRILEMHLKHRRKETSDLSVLNL